MPLLLKLSITGFVIFFILAGIYRILLEIFDFYDPYITFIFNFFVILLFGSTITFIIGLLQWVWK